jgi:serine/threonine-protein kinase
VGGVDPLFLELQTALLGRYSLERELGRGGMGIVYLARDVSLDRPIALKLLPPELAERRLPRERFLREARLAARLSHPNIVPIHAVEEAGRLVWFVMAYVPGESLGQRLRERGALPPLEAVRILRDVAWGLGYAHGQGVIHRDVKPDNILLEQGGRRALIADFGIAAAAREEDEPSGTVAGTVAYLSPEQAHGERLDGRSDLYSLGVVGYYALSTRLPYPVTRLADLVDRQLAGPPPSLATVAPHLPRALTRVIDRCLAPLPTARVRTGEELADALEHLGSSSTDLPAPFRVWLTHAERPRGALLFISIVWGLPLSISMFTVMLRGAPGMVPIALVSLAVVAFPWAIYGGARLLQTRRLLEVGYNHADIVRALEQHRERRHEELSFEYGTKATRLGLLLQSLSRVAIGVAVGGLFLALFLGPATLIPVAGAAGSIGLALYWVRRFVRGSRIAPRDRWVDLSLRLWRGRVGRWLTQLAGWRLKARGAPEAMLHRPTEIALGDAAEALFRALPDGDKRDLKDLPEQIRSLADQAQRMRSRVQELDDLIARAAPETLFGEERSARGDGGAAELTAARELWATRLRDTVSLLESLRLGLLRLHAGGAAAETLTADLEAARELRERLGQLLAAHAEADHFLAAQPS